MCNFFMNVWVFRGGIAMKKFACILVVITLLLFNAITLASEKKGAVVFYNNDDIIVIQNTEDSNYLVGKLYSYSPINMGDLLLGDMERYGFNNFYNLTSKENIKVYINEFLDTKDEFIKWQYRNDKKKKDTK